VNLVAFFSLEIQIQHRRGIVATPAVAHVHRVKGRNMHLLMEVNTLKTPARITLQHVTLTFVPWRIGYLDDDVAQILGIIEAVIAADRVNVETEVSQVRKHAYRAFVPGARSLVDSIQNRLFQRNLRIAKKIAALKSRRPPGTW
jgi:hypothetical protein